YPNFSLAHRRLGLIYEQRGMFAEAVAEFEKALKLAPEDTETMSALGHTYALWGRRTDAEVSLGMLNQVSERLYVSPYSVARVHLGLGQLDEAFEWLEKTYRERHGILVYVKVEPQFDVVRNDARFVDLMKRLALMDSAATSTPPSGPTSGTDFA